ncbi:S-Ena type endospore appendage [Priestia taiwanensis]|uniref:Endospore appendages core domain-containing protein n=1 Tax=Priestia taiwanensis TaxID=1347902 RepID=A0A917AS47_9BACI|nr:S-Ena type endospore appendage [Priestia taiwanensis]MBM7364057.1 hypothetical protein [Priestia taiwanensis]GGE71261.1 hypothetical protein GCM10007140_21470 [Priestia taiwanensis]
MCGKNVIFTGANKACCPQATLLVDEFCNNFDNAIFVTNPPFFGISLWFEFSNQRGTFTLTNNADSTGIAAFTFLDANGDVVATFFVTQGDSLTVSLSGVSSLFVAAFAPETTVSGTVCAKIFRKFF